MSGTLEDQAAARKAKLQALRNKKRKAEGDLDAIEGEEAAKPEAGVIAHRAYDRATGQSRRHVANEEETVESAVEGLAARIVAEDEARRKQELDLFNIQPRKPNWDLKRDVEKKLDKLRPIQQAAVAQLIRARMAGAGKETESGAAALAAAVAQADGSSDEED